MNIEQRFINESTIWALYEKWATGPATVDLMQSMNKNDFDVRELSERSWCKTPFDCVFCLLGRHFMSPFFSSLTQRLWSFPEA